MSEFKEGKFHVMEPIDDSNLFIINRPVICFAPGMAFSKEGHRIGYGGGYYDRFLKNKDILKIGTCFEEQIYSFLPERHDIDMDVVITDTSIYK